jgi:hypothetical protein
MNIQRMMIIGAVAVLLAAALLLYWTGRRDGAARERPKTEAALAVAERARLETEGARASAQRVDVVVRQKELATRIAADFTPKALTSEEAHAPLDPDRARRLRAADSELCFASPELGGCAPH